MENLLQEYYKLDLFIDRYHDRKLIAPKRSFVLCGITQSGKTKLIKSYLLTLPKKSYLYLDCSDSRIDIEELNATLYNFCKTHNITTVVLDNYHETVSLPMVEQLILISQNELALNLPHLWIYGLDYEEFLAFEYKYDSSALNHYLQLGGLLCMHQLPSDERVLYIQQKLQMKLNEIEFAIFEFIAKHNATFLSPFMIYERLKQKRKISKDKTYQSYKSLKEKRYIYELEKFEHPKAIKKLYLADIFFKTALSTDKHFGRLFENLIFLELIKHGYEFYYHDSVEFYLPKYHRVIIPKPFADERRLFKRIEQMEAFIIQNGIQEVVAITINKESTLSHPFATIKMIPFDYWALSEEEE